MYVIECEGKEWDDRFVMQKRVDESYNFFEWPRGRFEQAITLTKEKAESIIEDQGFGSLRELDEGKLK